jgi:hypothetical protein
VLDGEATVGDAVLGAVRAGAIVGGVETVRAAGRVVVASSAVE